MFDIGMPEMLVIAVVTLLVVGPKDLPKVIRVVAGGLGKIRRMVGEFKTGVEEFVRESELSELREAVDKTRAAMDVEGQIKRSIDSDGTLDQLMSSTKPTTNPASSTDGAAPVTGSNKLVGDA